MGISSCKVPGVRIPKDPNRSPLSFVACARYFGSRLCQCNELIVSSRGKPQEGGLRPRFPGCDETKACLGARRRNPGACFNRCDPGNSYPGHRDPCTQIAYRRGTPTTGLANVLLRSASDCGRAF